VLHIHGGSHQKEKRFARDIVAVPPQKIDSKKLFSLEVEEGIWAKMLVLRMTQMVCHAGWADEGC